MRLVALLVLAGLCGCTAQAADDGRVRVLAAAYPLAWAAAQVGGPDVRVEDLVRAGAEPHDVELSPRQIGAFERAALVVYLHGFQPAVDDAVREADTSARLDLTQHVTMRPFESDLTGDDESGTDPHVWVDPVRMSAIVRAVAERLSDRDPAHAAAYSTRAAATLERLRLLDADFRSSLRSCRHDELVTAHSAFGYLAERYGLKQVGVAGVSPDAEPSPGRLARVARYAEAHDVRTIFFGSDVDPKLADTVAREIGAQTAILDPVEGVENGDDYLSVMRRNARVLHDGLECA
ncbi:MAG: zinc transport system substrate-binding protein [Actinomycetota bacterium]|jgi:zinc transport system substrate-binding protein|nr:zinc transport system substrate-binding protein [Actinomycetota bacterium]